MYVNRKEYVLSRTKKNCLFCLISLIIGCLLYILFRPNTYIGRIFTGFGCVDTVRQICSHYASDLFKFYLPDFLWAFSLGCGLISIQKPKIVGVVICSFCSFLCGFIWELLQYFHVISGTADIHDVIMYFLASAICIIINIKEIN